MGASAGGVQALTRVAAGLEADIPAALLAVLHIPPQAESRLPQILSRVGPLNVAQAADGEPLRAGSFSIAAPNRHLVVSGGRMWLVDGPRENRVRPAADPLFRSAAREYGPRTIGVVLSGSLDDGASGLAEIRAAGGLTVVQDPADALADGMPRASLETVDADYVEPADRLGPLLSELAKRVATLPVEHLPVRSTPPSLELLEDRGDQPPTDIACPTCGGVLKDASRNGGVRFRCRVGHAFGPESLLSEQSQRLEDTIWAAIRAFEEQAATAGRLTTRYRERGADMAADRFSARQKESAEQADVLRAVMRGAATLLEEEQEGEVEVEALA
jgi:two-component system chemotaxis response regulator CheB